MAWPPTTHQDVQDEVANVRMPTDYLRSGYYSTGQFTGMNAAGTAVISSVANVRPFWVLRRRAFDRIGINVTTASTAGSGGLIQVGLYAPGGTPGALLYEGSPVSSETTGPKEWVISLTLDAGVYWVGARAVIIQCSVPIISSTEHSTPFVSAFTTPQTTHASHAALSANVVSGTSGMPAPADIVNTSSAAPLVVLRAA